MTFTIISPTDTQHYTVNWIEAQTPCGNIIIQPGHAPIILTILADTFLSFSLKTGENKKILLNRPGFLEVGRTGVMALINQE